MSSMSRTNSSTSSLKGFSILQPAVGAPLSWMPAMGTLELDQLIHAYMPGPASTQEKRAAVSIDFFEYSAQTGESFKYYPVNASAAGSSPAGSSFSASPVMSDVSYHASPSQASTPAPRMASTTGSRKPTPKAESTDFSHLPGMKILTIEGQDVTHSISRGCKTKEQREHAHLMRVLKACDACKRKKIRCDPSHKRRSTSQTKVAKAEATKPAAKKAKQPPPTPASQSSSAASFTPAPEASFDMDLNSFENFPALDQSWDEFLTFNDEVMNAPLPQDFYGAIPQEFDFFFGQENQLSPTISGSSGSFDSPAQPLTPVGSGVLAHNELSFTGDNTLSLLQAGELDPALPYLNPGGVHGSNYVDFNLFSPATSFIDEEPRKLKAGDKRKASALHAEPAGVQFPLTGANSTSSAAFNGTQPSTGLAHDQQWRFDLSGSTALSPHGSEWPVPGTDFQQEEASAGGLARGVASSAGEALPFHADNSAHCGARGRTAMPTRSHGLQAQQQAGGRSSITAVVVLPEERERIRLPPAGLSLGSPVVASTSSPISTRAVSPQIVVREDIMPVGGNAQMMPRTVSPTELHAVDSSRLTPRPRHTPSTAGLPSPVLATAVPSSGSLSRQGLVTAEGYLRGGLPAGGLQGLHAILARSANNAPVNGSGLTVANHASTRGPASGVLLRGEGELANGNTTAAATAPTSRSTTTHGLGLSLSLPGCGQAGQQLHGVAAPAHAASSSPQRLCSGESAVPSPLCPVRQLLSRSPSTTASTASSVLARTQLVVFGLVTMLLIVAVTSQLQLQAPIFAYLPSRSSTILLSLLSTLSAQPPASFLPSIGKDGAHDSVRSSFNGAAPSLRRSRDWSAWAFPRVASACS